MGASFVFKGIVGEICFFFFFFHWKPPYKCLVARVWLVFFPKKQTHPKKNQQPGTLPPYSGNQNPWVFFFFFLGFEQPNKDGFVFLVCCGLVYTKMFGGFFGFGQIFFFFSFFFFFFFLFFVRLFWLLFAGGLVFCFGVGWGDSFFPPFFNFFQKPSGVNYKLGDTKPKKQGVWGGDQVFFQFCLVVFWGVGKKQNHKNTDFVLFFFLRPKNKNQKKGFLGGFFWVPKNTNPPSFPTGVVVFFVLGGVEGGGCLGFLGCWWPCNKPVFFGGQKTKTPTNGFFGSRDGEKNPKTWGGGWSTHLFFFFFCFFFWGGRGFVHFGVCFLGETGGGFETETNFPPPPPLPTPTPFDFGQKNGSRWEFFSFWTPPQPPNLFPVGFVEKCGWGSGTGGRVGPLVVFFFVLTSACPPPPTTQKKNTKTLFFCCCPPPLFKQQTPQKRKKREFFTNTFLVSVVFFFFLGKKSNKVFFNPGKKVLGRFPKKKHKQF